MAGELMNAREELAIARVLNDAGAYCGECNFEDGFEGQDGCSQCAAALTVYAKALLASDWLARLVAEVKAAAIEEAARLIQLQRVLRGRIDEWRSGSDSAERVVLDLADAIRRTATPEGGK